MFGIVKRARSLKGWLNKKITKSVYFISLYVSCDYNQNGTKKKENRDVTFKFCHCLCKIIFICKHISFYLLITIKMYFLQVNNVYLIEQSFIVHSSAPNKSIQFLQRYRRILHVRSNGLCNGSAFENFHQRTLPVLSLWVVVVLHLFCARFARASNDDKGTNCDSRAPPEKQQTNLKSAVQ